MTTTSGISLELACLMEEIRRSFLSFVKLNRTENMGLLILSHTDGLHLTSKAKLECLNNKIISIFTRNDGRDLPDNGPSFYREMDNIRFTQPRIAILLKNTNQSKAAGPGELPANILKEIAKPSGLYYVYRRFTRRVIR